MWKRRRLQGGSQLEARLKALRAEPRSEFLRNLSEHVAAQLGAGRRAWSRLAFAGALSVFVLGTFASFGGMSYAASGVSTTYHAAKQVAAHRTLSTTVRKSSAADQYRRKPPKPKPRHGPRGGLVGVQAGVARPKGTLPFTGLSLVVTLVLSIGLTGAGLALRRIERGRK